MDGLAVVFAVNHPDRDPAWTKQRALALAFYRPSRRAGRIGGDGGKPVNQRPVPHQPRPRLTGEAAPAL